MSGQACPAPGAPDLVLPAQPPSAFAIYAFRRARSSGPRAPSALPSALAAGGIAVLTVDLGSAPFSATAPPDDGDLAALSRAAEALGACKSMTRLFNFRRAPSVSSLTIGGSAGCSATVPGAGSCPGSETRMRRVSPA
jgi:hypothetical protein